MSPQNEGNETKRNDGKLKKPLIVRLILLVNNTGNVQRTVKRVLILLFRRRAL